jgi:hypothetical protein
MGAGASARLQMWAQLLMLLCAASIAQAQIYKNLLARYRCVLSSHIAAKRKNKTKEESVPHCFTFLYLPLQFCTSFFPLPECRVAKYEPLLMLMH